MLNIPKKVSKRISKNFNKYVKILELAKQKDVNESDTVKVIRDILCDVFGYDKYLDITSEYEVKGKYCDIAIKVDDVLYFLIECQSNWNYPERESSKSSTVLLRTTRN